jgi:hypothetical protein
MTHRTGKKTNNPDGKPVMCQRTFISVHVQFFYTVKLHSLTYGVWVPYERTVYHMQGYVFDITAVQNILCE